METTDYYVNPLGCLIYSVDGYDSLISGVYYDPSWGGCLMLI